MLPNPYVLLALVIGWGASLVGVGYWQRHDGAQSQKVADQVQFDKINQKLTDQKAEANAAYRAFQEHNIALVVERDQLKTDLEKRHAKDASATDSTRDRLSGLGLRFTAGKDSGLGDRCLCSASAGTGASGTDVPATVELPAKITRDLRQLEYEADRLADAYRECYGYAMKVK